MAKYNVDNTVLSPQADKVLKAYRHSKDAFETARTDSEKAVRYVNNHSWTQSDVSTATKYKKPTLKYNIIVPILSTLLGNEQLNKKRARIKPTSMDALEVADIIQGRWNAINDEQDLEEKLQIAFMDALTTKVGGWIERRFEIDQEGYLDFKYYNINNMRIFIDPETKTNDYMLENCSWIVKEGWETLDVLIDKYQRRFDYKNEEERAWYDKLSQIFKRFSNKDYSNDPDYDRENDRFKVLEMQERVSVKMFKLFDGQEYFDIEAQDYSKFIKENPKVQKVTEFQQSRIHITTMIPYFENAIVYDDESKSPFASFDVFPVFSYNHNIQVNESKSLVDLLLDIQDDVNKGKSQLRDYVTQLLSGGLFIDKREREAIKQLRKRGNQPNQVYELVNPNNPPRQIPPGQIPPDIFNNTENSVQYAQRVSLVTEAMQGVGGMSGESGVLFQKKIERAAAAINPYYKSLAKLRKCLAKDFTDHFSYVYAEQDRVIRTRNRQGLFQESVVNLAMAAQVLNAVKNVSLYVELDEGDDNVTGKEENFEKMMALTNIISQVNPNFVDVRTLVESAPISCKDKMVSYIDQQQQAAQEASAQQAQIDQTKAMLENQKIERGMMNDEEKTRIEKEKMRKERAGGAQAQQG